MKSVRLIAPRRVEVLDVDLPKRPSPVSVLVDVETVGICGSDLHYFRHGGLGSFRAEMPMAMGHEIVGQVDGQRVIIDPHTHCDLCDMCRVGRFNLCRNGTFTDNGMTEKIWVWPDQIIETDLPPEKAVMLEPFSVGMYAASKVPSGSDVTVFGAGPIGTCTAKALGLYNANSVTFVEPIHHRRLLAERMGHYAYSIPDDLEIVPNVVIDAAGTQESIQACFDSVRVGGIVILVGIPEVDYIMYNPHKARVKEVTILNVRRSNLDMKTCYPFMHKEQWHYIERMTMNDCQEAFEMASDEQYRYWKVAIDVF